MIRVKFNREKFNSVLKSKGIPRMQFIKKVHYTQSSWYVVINHLETFGWKTAEKIAKVAKCKVKDMFDLPEYVRFKSVTTNMKTESSFIMFELQKYTGKSKINIQKVLLKYEVAVKLLRAMKKKYKRDFDMNKIFINDGFEKNGNGEGWKKRVIVKNKSYSRENSKRYLPKS